MLRHGAVILPGKGGPRVEPRTLLFERERCGQTEQGAGDEQTSSRASPRRIASDRRRRRSRACICTAMRETSERIVAGDVVEPEPLGAHQRALERPGRGDQPADLSSSRSRLRLSAARICARSGAPSNALGRTSTPPSRTASTDRQAELLIPSQFTTFGYPAPTARATPAKAPWRDGPPGRPVFSGGKAEVVVRAMK